VRRIRVLAVSALLALAAVVGASVGAAAPDDAPTTQAGAQIWTYRP
jgi:zinc transporter ZupT